MERSKLLRNLLANAKMIPRSSASEPGSKPSIGSLDGYSLLEAHMAKQDEDMGVKYEFDDWLRRTMENKYFPTIYFPPREAGPDIVFCLRHEDNKDDRILCALQVSAPLWCPREPASLKPLGQDGAQSERRVIFPPANDGSQPMVLGRARKTEEFPGRDF
jgi:hypothetical protein